LEELEKNDLFNIGNKIFSIYQEAYGINENFDDIAIEKCYDSVKYDSGTVRAFVKKYVAMLDNQYGPPRRQ